MTTTNADVAAATIKHVAFSDLESELMITRRFLERVPEQHLGWKPHHKSWALGGLATFLATLPSWGSMILDTEGLDLARGGTAAEAKSREEILRRFDENATAFREALDRADDAALAEPWTLRMGERVILSQPKHLVVRTSVISHLAHHRAQLGVYFRLLDIAVPQAYGPTADEQGF